MKKIVSMLVACLFLFSVSCSWADCLPGEEAMYRDVDAWDFDLRFALNPDTASFRDRKMMQGYAELLDNLELKGSYAWCQESYCEDIHFSVIPVSNPEASLDFRIFGRRLNWLNVSSPLLGESAVCFQPKKIMNFTVRAFQWFELPLFPIAILLPDQLEAPYRELAYEWEKEIDALGDETVLTQEAIGRITEGLRFQLENDERVTAMTEAIVRDLNGGELAEDEIHALPDLLAHAADGGAITIEQDGEIRRFVNHRGEVLCEERNGEKVYEARLTLPPSGTDYTPAYSFRREEGENESSLQLAVSWDRTSGNEDYPECIFSLEAAFEHIPSVYPADAEMTGEIAVGGYLLPNFHFLVKAVTGADGSLEITLSLPDRPEAGPVFTVTGLVTPHDYGGEQLVYQMGEIVTDFDLFALNDQTLNDLIVDMLPATMEIIPDFIYEMPTHGVQSVLDTLDQYGLLQTTLK